MDNFKELLVDFLNSEILVYMMYFYLLCLVFYTIWSLMNYFKYHSRMKKTLLSLYTQMSDQEKSRAEEERRQREIHGERHKRDFLAVLDERLAYSGIKDKFRWMTTEMYLIIVILITCIMSTVLVVLRGPVYGLLTVIIVILSFELIINTMIVSRNKKTESIMLQFMNIVDNFSKTSDDLITILEKSSRYIDEPLSSQIYDAVIEARNSGDTLLVLQELQDKVKNKHFKILIRNLEISSRYETNYSDIVEDCRDIFHDYIKSEKEKRNIRINGLMEIITMFVGGFFCLYLMGDITDSGNLIDTLLANGTLGMGILIYLLVSIILALYVAIFKVLRTR